MYYPERENDDDYGDYHQGFSGLSVQPSPVYTMMSEARPQSAFSDSDRVMDRGPSYSASSSGASRQPQRPVQIRKTFPETWLFDTLDFNSS